MKLRPLPGISKFSMYSPAPAAQVTPSSGTYEENEKLLLWRTVVELGHWLVKSVLEPGWLLEEDVG